MRHLIIYMLLMLVALPLRAEDAYDPTLPPDPAAAYTVTLTSAPDGHATFVGDGAYLNNSEVTILCQPEAGYAFSHWTQNGTTVASTAQYSFTMPCENIHLVAHLVKLNLRTLTLTSNYPDAAIFTGAGSYYMGDTVSILCESTEDYTFRAWMNQDVVFSESPSFYFVMPDEDMTLVAQYDYTPHGTVTITSADSTAGVVANTGGLHPVGEVIEIAATPNAGYSFSHWLLNGTQFTPLPRFSYTVRDSEDHFVAVFEYDPLSPDDPVATTTTAIYVESAPSGIATFNIVSGARYHEGDTILISAELSSNYRFDGWYAGATKIATSMEFLYVVRDRSETLTLRATPIIYSQIILESQPQGVVTFNTASTGVYEAGTQLALRASTPLNYTFEGWYIGDSLLANTPELLFTIPEAATILTAMASIINPDEEDDSWNPTPPTDPGERQQANITVLSSNPIMGRTIGSANYFVGDIITIEAIPNAGYEFVQWEDGSTELVRTIEVTENASYTATFTPKAFQVSVLSNNEEMGYVYGGGSFYYKSTATVTAVPKEGYRFLRWSDDNAELEHNIYVTSDTTLTAYFAPITYTITAQSSNTRNGSVTGGGEYQAGELVELTAVPAPGCEFTQWADGNTDNPRTIYVTEDATYTAMFIAPMATIRVLSNQPHMGTVYGAGSYFVGDTAVIKALPDYGYQFTKWDDESTDSVRIFEVTGNATFRANFSPMTFTLNAVSDNEVMGTVTGGGAYPYLTEVTITAQPNDKYKFVRWSDGNSEMTRTISLKSDMTLTAYFTHITYLITAQSSDLDYGTVSGTGVYNVDSVAELVAEANTDCKFLRWSDGVTDNPRYVTVTKDEAFIAIFVPKVNISVESSDITMGQTTGAGDYYIGDTITIEAIPEYGYEFVQWSDGVTSAQRTIVVSGTDAFKAMFTKKSFAVTIQSNDDMMGVAMGSGSYLFQSTVTIYAQANYGYQFVGWSDGVMDAVRNIYVTADTTITASFEPIIYQVVVSASPAELGTVTGGGSYPMGEIITLTAIPNTDAEFVQWSDGVMDNPRDLYVESDVNIVAMFKQVIIAAVEDVMATEVVAIVDLFGRRYASIQNLPQGAYIIKYTNGNIQKIVIP